MPLLTTVAQAPYKTLLMAEKSKTVKCSAVPTGTLFSGTLQLLPQSRGGFSDFFFFFCTLITFREGGEQRHDSGT